MLNALLVIDVQKGFVNSCTRDIPAYAERIQHEYEHVYVSRFINAENSPFREFLNNERYSMGSEEAELAFTPADKAFIYDKYGYTSATPSLLENLNARKIDTIDLIGMDLDACVAKTAFDLFENGIRPVILISGCGVTAGEMAEGASIRNLARLIGVDNVIL